MKQPAENCWQNLLNLLRDLEAKGVKMRLSDDSAEFQFSVKKGVLSEEEKAGIEICRTSLTRALRLREGLCVTCGIDAAKKSNLSGREKQIVGHDDDGIPVVKWVNVEASEKMKERYPRMYCDSCYTSGAYLRMIGEKTSAKSNHKPAAKEADARMVEAKTLFED